MSQSPIISDVGHDTVIPETSRPRTRFVQHALPLILGAGFCFNIAALASHASEQPSTVQQAAHAGDPDLLVQKLISQLGSDRYFLRHQAQQRLIEMGPDVFDELQLAEKHTDLEIASRSQYILQVLRIPWVHIDDPREVQQALAHYGELSPTERDKRIRQLAVLAKGKGWAGLCRIARFDPSGLLARRAALRVMKQSLSANDQSLDVEHLLTELGDSRRVPVRWLRTTFQQSKQSERKFHRWLTFVDEEISLVEENSPVSEVPIVYELLEYHLKLCKQASDAEAMFASLKKRTDFHTQQNGQQRDGVLVAMDWLLKNHQWGALALLEDHYHDMIFGDRLLIYMAAAARWTQGNTEEAEEVADRAFRHQANDAEQRNTFADWISELGYHDWAEREWWFVIDTFPILDSHSMKARRSLAIWRLHDRGEDQEAAALLAEVCDAVEEDPQLKRNLLRGAEGHYLLNQLIAQKDFFLACDAESKGNVEKQRKHLESAYGRDNLDADVLIAMYRASASDDKYRKITLERIQKAANTVEDGIGQDPQGPQNPQLYNHWAWLISNTEGDYEKAVKYSLRSLKLDPESPSYLDTLGRCYFSIGDLEKAVEYQRKAVQRYPQMQVMREQLDLFEETLAAQSTNSQ